MSPSLLPPENSPRPFDADSAWNQLLARDPKAQFLYGVTTTGVFCRPTCSSRRPLRRNVRFFDSIQAARSAGFRPCQRCRPTAASEPQLLDQLRSYLEANRDRTISLADLGRLAGLSPFTVQRQFKNAMGVSPLQYQRALRAGSLRAALRKGDTVTQAIYNAGFNSSSRAYADASLGMTPSRFAAGGRGETIGWDTAPSQFGWIIVGATQRGLCWLALEENEAAAETTLRAEFPAAALHRDPSLAPYIQAALLQVTGQSHESESLPLDLRGTAFQFRVWQALRAIPRGTTLSYSQLAAEMGMPNATRAVARACALNRVALVVPCHRIVGASGGLTGYRWGVDRKRKLLEVERSPRP